MNSSLRGHFSENQINIIMGKSIRARAWDDETVMKAVVLKHKGGQACLEFTRRHIAPLPCVRTIQRHFEALKYKPGILNDNIEVLRHQVADFSVSQLRFGIYFDEKALIPGESLDPCTGEYIGKITLPPRDEYATNILCFLCCGIECRLKMPVAYQFTGKSDTGKAQAEFLIDLVKYVEEHTAVKIDFVVFDLGPTNVSMLKNYGLSLKKGSRTFWINHPCDSNRKLFFIPDLEHCTKNVIAGLRNHNVTISNRFVDQFSLVSATAKISDVEKLCKSQMNYDFKASKKLTDSIVNPDHFTKMKSQTFEALMAPDVVTSLELFDKIKRKGNNEKMNPTAFLLAQVDQWHSLTSRGQINSHDAIYQDQKKFMLEAIDLIDTLLIGNRHNICQTGSAWGTLALLELSEFWIDIGMPFVKPQYLLNNCIENLFSLIASKQLKPSAVHATHGLKSISISKFMNEPINGSYNWEKNEELTDSQEFSILTLLKGRKNNRNNNSDVDVMIPVLDVPEIVHLTDIFDHEFEHQKFYCFLCDLSTSIFSKNDCEVCDILCIDAEHTFESYHQLQNMKSSTTNNPLVSSFSTNMDLLRPSIIMENFYFQLEYVYSELLRHDMSPVAMKTAFINEVFSGVSPSFIHCKSLEDIVVENFIDKRIKLIHEVRLVHRKSRFASKSLQN